MKKKKKEGGRRRSKGGRGEKGCQRCGFGWDFHYVLSRRERMWRRRVARDVVLGVCNSKQVRSPVIKNYKTLLPELSTFKW